MNLAAMSDELLKIAAMEAGVTEEQALASLSRLRALEETKPSRAELARGALAGSVVGGTGRILSGAVAGDLKTPTMEGLRAAAGVGAKLKQFTPIARQLGGALIPGAMIGAALPVVKNYMGAEAEKEKLRQYLGTSELDPTRSKIKQTLGV